MQISPINVQISTNKNKSSIQQPCFGIKMVKGINLRTAEKNGHVSEVVGKQIEELGQWMEKFIPHDREVVLDFERDYRNHFYDDFQYVVKPFDADPKTGVVPQGKYVRDRIGEPYKSEDAFLKEPISQGRLTHLAYNAGDLGRRHESGEIVLKQAKNK